MDHQPPTRTPPLTGELIVRRGPDRGTSRPLLVPFTLLGRAEHCDLRILDFLVRPIHCAVSITPDGPHLRSLGGTTIVNGLPTQERLLQQGDIVTVGPIELEVHWYMPPAPTPNANIVHPQETTRLHEPHSDSGVPYPVRKIARMKNRLVQHRLQLLHERVALRADVSRQLDTIGELRLEGEHARLTAVAELAQLRQLRRQFLKQWKRYWRRKRLQLEHEQQSLQQAQQEFAAQQQAWQDERATLQQAHEECRQRCTRTETDLARRTAELDRREADLLAREQQQAQRLATANDLQAEIAGLEARVQHLRTSLPHEPAIHTPTLTIPPVNDRLPILQTIAATLADQRQALAEQVRLLLQTSNDQQQTQSTLLSELEALTEDVLRREHDLEHAERHMVEQQRYLELWQARLLDQQIEVEQQSASTHSQQQQAMRHEAIIKRVGQRWATRRQTELAHLKAELEHIAMFRRHVELQRFELFERDAQLLQQAQQWLLDRHATTTPDQRTRDQRRLHALFAKRADEQQTTLATIRAESAALQQLHDQTQERLIALATEQREWSANQAAHEHEAAPSLVIDHETTLANAERYIDALRAEIQRLTQLLEQPTPTVGPRRAA